jgi:UDP-2,3-diacylglucosamine hydrolase
MSDTLDAALVVASDIHLRHLGDERGRLLLDVLARVGRVEYLVLNGDICDFCNGDSRYFRSKFAALGAALSDVAKSGTKVLFIEGNHEFNMSEIGWDGVEIVTERDRVVTLSTGERIKFSHGDLIKDDPWYRAFRGLVKSRFARYGSRLIPGRWLDAYSLKHASVSRAQDKYRKLDHAKILAAFNRWLGDGSYDHGIIGHFHVPYAEKRETHDGLMLSVDSWDLPNLLVYRGARFQRVFLRGPGAPFEFEAAESIFRGK